MAYIDESLGMEAVEWSGRAMYALGQLEGSLRHLSSAARSIFAGKLLKACLMIALRQEGHAFTDTRFHAWFAGLATLSDAAPRNGRPPRAVCLAILTELGHSSWEPLSGLALSLREAFLAPQDFASPEAHQEAFHVVREAGALTARLVSQLSLGNPSPVVVLRRLQKEMKESLQFAPRKPEPDLKRPLNLNAECGLSPPLWALDLFVGQWLGSSGGWLPALPCPGLVRAQPDGWDARPSIPEATNLFEAISTLLDLLAEASKQAQFIEPRPPQFRSSSRAPDLFALIAGFGPLRSSQLETMLSASRLGIRSMTSALEEAHLIDWRRIAGSHLFEARLHLERSSSVAVISEAAFSPAALDEFEASLAALDRLLPDEED